jgi:hypothetical protein
MRWRKTFMVGFGLPIFFALLGLSCPCADCGCPSKPFVCYRFLPFKLPPFSSKDTHVCVCMSRTHSQAKKEGMAKYKQELAKAQRLRDPGEKESRLSELERDSRADPVARLPDPILYPIDVSARVLAQPVGLRKPSESSSSSSSYTYTGTCTPSCVKCLAEAMESNCNFDTSENNACPKVDKAVFSQAECLTWGTFTASRAGLTFRYALACLYVLFVCV